MPNLEDIRTLPKMFLFIGNNFIKITLGMIVSAIFLLMCLGVYFMYIQIDIINKEHIILLGKDSTSESLEFASIASNRINDILDDLNHDTGSGRAAVVQFHNGTESFAKVPFHYFSMTFEVVEKGTMSEIKHIQRHPIGMIAKPLDSFISDQCFNTAITKPNPTLGFELEKHQVDWAIMCPLWVDGGLDGYISIEFMKKDDIKFDFTNSPCEKVVRASSKISGLLEATK